MKTQKVPVKNSNTEIPQAIDRSYSSGKSVGVYVKKVYETASHFTNDVMKTGMEWWSYAASAAGLGSYKTEYSILKQDKSRHADNQILPIPEFKVLIEDALQKFITKKYEEYKTISAQPYVHNALTHTEAIVMGGGKRARPYLAYLAGKTYAASVGIPVHMPLHRLTGIELFHIFALMHDDIIDKSTSRHGVVTLHEQQKEALLQMKEDIRTVSHEVMSSYGTAQAILVGDLIFSWAFESIFNRTVPHSNELQKLFHRMIDEVVIGQMIDVSIGLRKSVDAQELEEKNNLKSARYTFVMPLAMGAAIAKEVMLENRNASNLTKNKIKIIEEKNSNLRTFFEEIGTALGLAFQIQDDILDMVGDSNKTGKPTMLDVEAGQHTYLSNYVRTHGETEDIAKLNQCFGKSLSSTDRHNLQLIFKKSGALEYAETMVTTYIEQSYQLIEKQNFGDEVKKAWLDLVRVVAGRKS